MTNEELHIGRRGGGSDLDQHNGGGTSSDGRRGVHGNAERAVVRRAYVGVKMRDLNDGEDRQQGQTQDRHYRPGDWPGAAIRAEMGLESCQIAILSLKDTQNWTLFDRKGFPGIADGLGRKGPTERALVRLNCVR